MPVTLPRLITTPRLELRVLTADQAAAQVEAANASLPELALWMPWAQKPQTIEVATELLAKDTADFDAGESFEYSMWLGDAFIGRIGVHAVDQRIPKGEIGYWTATSHTHHGYAREACQGLINAML
ncbi:MAG: GNAT family N-acetyltransferase, partial [Propionibacteriaceae bacterium]